MTAGRLATRTDLRLEHFRQALEGERLRLRQEIEAIQTADGVGARESSVIDRDEEADPPTEIVYREQDAAMLEQFHQELRDVEQAQNRMTAGDYGYCIRCHSAIPVERLEALPFTPFCLSCAEVFGA